MTVDPEITYAACLTPPGRGAIAALAVRGPNAWAATRRLFRPAYGATLPDEPEPRRFWFGRLGIEPADEVIVSVQRGGPAPWIEVHCHGGPEAIRWLLEAFTAQGVQSISWQEIVRRAAPPGTRARAEIELAQAPTVRTASILLDQFQGAFDRALLEVRAALDQNEGTRAEALLSELTRYVPIGTHLTVPWRVAVIGPPNVGKSSLINALTGFQRSIVSPTPGTTRDVVTTLIAIDGWPVELADTAGLRVEADDLEGEGIARAQRAAKEADLCLWLFDASTLPIWREGADESVRYVINKVDLPAAWDLAAAPDAVPVSARSGEGLEELCGAIGRWLVAEAPPAGAAVPFSASMCEQLLALRELVIAGRLREAAGQWEELWHDADSPQM